MQHTADRPMHTQDDSRTTAATEQSTAPAPDEVDATGEAASTADAAAPADLLLSPSAAAPPLSDPSLSDPLRFAREELQLEQQVQREVDDESDGMHDLTNPLEEALNEEEEEEEEEEEQLDGEAGEEQTEAQADAEASEQSASAELPPLIDLSSESASAAAVAVAAAPSSSSTLSPRTRTPVRSKFTHPRDASLVLSLVRARNYAGAIEHFRALWTHWTRRGRAVPGLTSQVLERYLHALSTLHQYADVLALLSAEGMDKPLRKMWMRSPIALDTLLQACIRHPKDAPIHDLCYLLSRMDIYRDREHQQSVATLKSAVPSMPAPVLTLLMTEKVVNQLIKAALLRNDGALAMDICYQFVMGYRVSRFTFTATEQTQQPLYATRNYRLHSQAAHGLIMYLLHSQQYSQDTPAAPPTLRLAPSLPYPDLAHHTSLFRAFRVYLQTRFIENLLDNELLLRILRTVISAVLNPPKLAPGTLSYKRLAAKNLRLKNAWLAFQIYGYILRHNESIRRADASHEKITAAAVHSPAATAKGGRRKFDPTDSASSSSSGRSHAILDSERGLKDTPWSCTNHRRFIPLQWEAHHRPLIQICLLRLEGLSESPSPAALTGESEVKFDASLLLDQLLYDVRMSHQDYSVLLADRLTGLEEREEIEALELSEASQDEELAQYSTTLTREKAAGISSALSVAHPLPPMTLLPNMPLRPFDAPLFLQLAQRHLRVSHLVGVLMVYQSIPALKRFDALRTEIVEMTLTLLLSIFASAPARHLVNNTRAMITHMQAIAQSWRDPAAVQARRAAAATQSAQDAMGNMIGFELHPLSLNQLLAQHLPQNQTLYAMHLHSTAIAENAASGLSFLLRLFGRLDEFGTCFHFFNQEVWRVPPSRGDFEILLDLMTRAQHMTGGTHVVRALQLTLMLQSSSLRPLPTLLLVFKAYTSLTGLPHAWFLKGAARHKLHASADEPDVGRQVGENLAQLFAHILRMHIQPLMAMPKPADPSVVPPQVTQLLQYLQAYLAWRTQHRVPRRTAADLLPEETYLRLAHRYPSAPGVEYSVLCPALTATDAPTFIAFTAVPASGVLVVQPAGQWALLSPDLRTEWCAMVPSIADAMDNARNVKQRKEQEAAEAAAATATGATPAAAGSASTFVSPPKHAASTPAATRSASVKSLASAAVDLGVAALDSIRASFRSRRVTHAAQTKATAPSKQRSSPPPATPSPAVASASPRRPPASNPLPPKSSSSSKPKISASNTASVARVLAALNAKSPAALRANAPMASVPSASSRDRAKSKGALPAPTKAQKKREQPAAAAAATAGRAKNARKITAASAAATATAAPAHPKPSRIHSTPKNRVVSTKDDASAQTRSRSAEPAAAAKVPAPAKPKPITAARSKTVPRTPRARSANASAAASSATTKTSAAAASSSSGSSTP